MRITRCCIARLRLYLCILPPWVSKVRTWCGHTSSPPSLVRHLGHPREDLRRDLAPPLWNASPVDLRSDPKERWQFPQSECTLHSTMPTAPNRAMERRPPWPKALDCFFGGGSTLQCTMVPCRYRRGCSRRWRLGCVHMVTITFDVRSWKSLQQTTGGCAFDGSSEANRRGSLASAGSAGGSQMHKAGGELVRLPDLAERG